MVSSAYCSLRRPGSVYMRSDVRMQSDAYGEKKSHRMLDTTYELSTSYTHSLIQDLSLSLLKLRRYALHAIIKQLASVVEICAAAEAAVRFSPVVASDIMR